MNETPDDRWPKVVEAGSIFVERLQPLFVGSPPELDALFEALVRFYVEVPVAAFSSDEQYLIIEWGDSEGADWFALRRGFSDDGRCCDISIDAYFARTASCAKPESSNCVCDDAGALPNYCVEIRSLPIFQRNAHTIPMRLSLYAASNCGDGHEYPEIHIKEPNKSDAGNGSKAICRVSNVHPSPSPDPSR